MSPDNGEVDLSQVILSNGKGLVRSSGVCFLCGKSGGLKALCKVDTCCATLPESSKSNYHLCFHATCARQAGLEVSTVEVGRQTDFYGELILEW